MNVLSAALTILSLTGTAGPAQAPAPSRIVAASNLEFHSDLLINLHHTLYGAAWAGRPEAGTLRALAGKLPAPLEAAMTPAERAAWDAAVSYYNKEVASRDLLFGRGMRDLKDALLAGDLSHKAVGEELRAVLESALPIYRRYFWPSHDRANRSWIESTTERLRTVASDVTARLTKTYGLPWFSSPVRVDIVWVGNRQGAYATDDPTHATISSGDPDNAGWTAVEIVFHEVSHTLIAPIERRLRLALGDRVKQHGVLWHVVQFYVTGGIVQQVLRERGIEYSPYLYSTGLFDRAWSQYRQVVERWWQPYVDGKATLDETIDGTIKAVTEK